MAKTVLPSTSMINSTLNNTIPTHDEIAAQAYQIYLREGCVEGRDMDHWLQAEAELRERANGHSNGISAGTGARTERASVSSRGGKSEQGSILPNSVVPPSTPIAQVTRTTTPRRNNGKREAAAAK
jgi:hypothetical protein